MAIDDGDGATDTKAYNRARSSNKQLTLALPMYLHIHTYFAKTCRDMANVDFDKTHLYGDGALRTVDDLKRVRGFTALLIYPPPFPSTPRPYAVKKLKPTNQPTQLL